VRELDKLVEIYQLSERLTNLREPGSSITWAREIKNINKSLLTPTVLDTIVRKVNDNEITNSKEIRKLRIVLKDAVAKEKFVAGESLDHVLDVMASTPDQPKKGSLAGDIDELTQALRRHSWTTLAAARGDAALLERVEEAEKLLRELRRALG
jgi:ParB family chromosome partitioning protein